LICSCGFHEITRMINGIDDLYGILFGVNKVNPMILRVFLVGSLWGCSEVKKNKSAINDPQFWGLWHWVCPYWDN
jgi:hypothetical protein